MVPAIVLAGAPNTGRLKEKSPASFEALIELNGRPIVAYVVEALLATPSVQKVLVVGPVFAPEQAPERLFFLPPQGGMLENLGASLDALSDASRVLVVTGDIPLLTPSAVEGFIRLCGDQGAEAYYPVVPRSTMEEALPGVKRTYVRLRNGSFTGGNVGLVDPVAVKRCLNRARDFVRLRKKPFRLAMVVGIGFLVRFVLGYLSLGEAEEKVSKLLGIKGRAVVTPFPEIGMDVDKPSDLEIVETALAIRAKTTA